MKLRVLPWGVERDMDSVPCIYFVRFKRLLEGG